MNTTMDNQGEARAAAPNAGLAVATRIFNVHHSVPIHQTSVRASDFGRERWGLVNSFEQVVARPPMGAGPLFEESTVFRGFRAVFRRGESWESTEWFKRNLRLIESGQVVWNCRDREQWLERLNGDVRALYESIQAHGFLDQETIASKVLHDADGLGRFARESYPAKLDANHEIKLGINEAGQLLFLDGRHRLAIAKLLKVPSVPVRVVFVHRTFLERRLGWTSGDDDAAFVARLTPGALSAIIADHLAAMQPGVDQLRYLTQETFLSSVGATAPNRIKSAAARWEFHKSAIDFVRLCRPRAAEDVLELLTSATPSIVVGSHSLHIPTGKGAGASPQSWLRDAGELPWAIADKQYDVLVALRVFHYLAPRQRAFFLEARRVARHLVMIVPDADDVSEDDPSVVGVSEAQFVEWNNGVRPTVSVKLQGRAGRLYLWSEASLRA